MGGGAGSRGEINVSILWCRSVDTECRIRVASERECGGRCRAGEGCGLLAIDPMALMCGGPLNRGSKVVVSALGFCPSVCNWVSMVSQDCLWLTHLDLCPNSLRTEAVWDSVCFRIPVVLLFPGGRTIGFTL